MYTTFWRVAIGTKFWCNGNEYIKRSPRTARMVSNDRVFYMLRKDLVTIGESK